MALQPRFTPEETPRSAARSLLGLERAVGEIGGEFARAGALGALVLAVPSLPFIERRYGGEARRQILERLDAAARELVGIYLAPGDRSFIGELGRDELVMSFVRSRADVRFYTEVLPELGRRLDDALATRSARIGYPFVRDSLPVGTGTAFILHDPTVRAETLIRRVRDLALRDATLRGERIAARRRTRFMGLLLAEDVRAVFEPIERLTTRERLGFEALIRGPEGSELVSPKALFEAAEEAGTLFELDCLCRRVALRAARSLPEGAKLFLNIRPSAIHDPAFQGDALRRLLQEAGRRPEDIVFEISERESIDNFAIFREICDRYAELGFGIALDDVGVGYGSLEAVSELSPNYIKVDIAFVRNLDEDPARREILAALNGIARRLGAHIIAEGIETPAELETLRSLAIPFGQGYLLGRAGALPAPG